MLNLWNHAYREYMIKAGYMYKQSRLSQYKPLLTLPETKLKTLPMQLRKVQVKGKRVQPKSDLAIISTLWNDMVNLQQHTPQH